VRDGVIAWRYFPNFFDGMSDFAQIDASDAIQEKDGSIDFILEHEGVAFTGVAYEFDDDICCREIAYKNGRWYGDAQWNAGELCMFSLDVGDFFETYEWDEEHRLIYAEICGGADFSGIFGWVNCDISFISISHNFFARSKIADRTPKFLPLPEEKNMINGRSAPEVRLSGSGIDNFFLHALVSDGVLKTAKNICLSDCALDSHGLLSLKEINGLDSITISSKEMGECDKDYLRDFYDTKN
jgi:hypothetical protein